MKKANSSATVESSGVGSHLPGLHDRGVQVQVVRHHRGAQDADRDVEHRRVGHDLGGRHQSPNHLRQRGPRHEELHREADRDRADQHDDEGLEPPEPLVLEQEDQQDVEGGEDHAPEQRNAEQQVQRDGRADDLGQIAGRDGDLAEDPEHEADRPRVVVAAGLGQVAAGDDPQLQRERLEQDRHEVGEEDHAQERVSEACATRYVGGPVAGVHVAHGHHVPRTGEGERLPPERASARHAHRAVRLGQARAGPGIAPPSGRLQRRSRGAHTSSSPAQRTT